MASRVYSIRFLSGRANSALQASAISYTVPVGKLIIVRSVDIFVDVLGAMLLGRVQTNIGFAHFVSSQSRPQYTVEHWEGRQVLTAGEVLGVQWLSGEHRISASGYLLDA